MSNVLAIAGKELKSYFATPIAFVILTFFTLIYGWFFTAILFFVNQQSARFGAAGGGPPVNLDQQFFGPLFQNVMVILLFILPLITMRTYSEEKRAGTMELLLTSPVTDLQIVMGKFLGAMGMVAGMLAMTLPHVFIIFWFADPEWKPIATSYLGFFLMAGCFIAVGLFISSLTRNQIVAAMATFAVFLMLWVIDWMGTFMGPTGQAVFQYLSITGHFEDFTRGVLDTKHLVYYASFILFGLFLTMRSVETERWRG
ncbi:MAG TPA: ABC transporter permease [Vicinamibacterales bacterium]|nr:ABC transporter permease [Vicinamibacterales bacterium]